MRIIIVIMLLSTNFLSAGEANVPIIVGGDNDLDPCGIIGTVDRLKPVIGNSLNLRSGPSKDFSIVGKLRQGDEFIQCNLSKDGEWLGIVVPTNRDNDCDLGSPIATETTYFGECPYGWIHRSYTSFQNYE